MNNVKFVFFNNEERINYINNYNQSLGNIYSKLNVGAYKADLWRYCILYIKGGIYLDIKYFAITRFNHRDNTRFDHRDNTQYNHQNKKKNESLEKELTFYKSYKKIKD